MSENLSIDEIIKQAEEIRKKVVKQAESTKESIEAGEFSGVEKTIAIPDIKSDEQDDGDMKIAGEEKTNVIDSEALRHADEEKTRVIDQKTRAIELDQKTGVVGDLKKVKKSYFNSDGKEPVYSKRPPEMVEKPATIKSKSSFDHTSDLEELPTIVAVDELENTRIVFNDKQPKPSEQNTYDSDESDQIVLEGFEDADGKVEKIDERLAEKQLAERRKEKVNKFRLFSPDEVEEEEKTENKLEQEEYTSRDDKTVFREKLFAMKSATTFSALFTFGIGLIVALLTRFQSSAYLPSFLLNDTVFFSVCAVLYFIALVINVKVLVHGFKVKKGINSDFPIAVSNVILFLHTVLLAVDVDMYIDGGALFALVGIFSLFMSQLGKRRMLTRIIKNFEFILSLDELHTVETIANTIDATIISRGVLTGEANLKTSIKTDFTTKFLDISSGDEPADNIARVTGSVMFALSFVLFVASSIIEHSIHYGFNIAVCAMAISVPCISLFCTNSTLLNMSKSLEENGAMINGFEGANMVVDANAIVIEAQDLFGARSCEIHGIKTFNGAKADDVIIQTAAVIMKTKSPLSSVFDDVIIGKQTILPEVEDVVYEDRLGTSAWIYRKKVLVGTRELLSHHGVQVPREEFEKRYTRKNRKILYLAIAGKLMAMFVVSYNAEPKLKRALRKLEKSGLTILVKSSDPFINDESIAQLFQLPDGFVRVMSAANGRTFEKYSDMCVEKSPAYVIHNGSALGFVSAMSGAEGLEEARRILSVLITFGCALGIGIVTLLSFMNGLGQLNSINIVLFQTVWCLFIQVLSKLKRSV
ncbi:MAG: hypothetical protein IJ851_02465 [Eubacterium sp.]|nr:hypothetical protein [Eubacterium sp.]